VLGNEERFGQLIELQHLHQLCYGIHLNIVGAALLIFPLSQTEMRFLASPVASAARYQNVRLELLEVFN
jgi:hypothetical protein